MPRRDDIERILVLGSGPIVIGQAAEFDYSGAQACKVLLEEGYEVILVNSNPATIMTDPGFADRTYLEPLDVEGVRSGRIAITSQNHGFAVAGEAGERLESEIGTVELTHVNLYDGTVEGLDFPREHARSAQFHPEAGPGPHDAWPIIGDFVEELKAAA